MADPPNSDLSIAELLQRLSTQTSDLVRQELRLAQLEVTEKGKRFGIGGGLFGAAALVALYAVGALVAAAILVLATAIAPWLAALAIAVLLFVIAGVAALVGKGQVQKAVPPTPEQTIESVKADLDTVKTKSGRA